MDWPAFAKEFEKLTDARIEGSSERWKAAFAPGGPHRSGPGVETRIAFYSNTINCIPDTFLPDR